MRQVGILILEVESSAGPARELSRGLRATSGFEVFRERLPPGGDAGALLTRSLRTGHRASRPELLLLCLQRPDAALAAELLRLVAALVPGCPLLVAVHEGEPGKLLELLDLGVADYLCPPFDPAHVLPRLLRVLDRGKPERDLHAKLRRKTGLRQIVGRSPAFVAQVDRLAAVARCDVNVLIAGETGTGKELFGRALHYLSHREAGPFVPVNCGAIPPDLVENELFGHRRAAYTGATTSSSGLVAEARRGTLFLDEIDALPPHAQVKILRFLQEREYRPLGSPRTLEADVRVAAATNAEPEKAVAQGRLRPDLYYRLDVVRLDLPPLRRRPEDVPLLAEHFLARFNRRFERRIPGFTDEALEALVLYPWPGNVRELEHVIERAVVLSRSPKRLELRDLSLPSVEDAGTGAVESFREAKARAVSNFERRYVRCLLAAHRGNISKAARAARKDRKSFWLLIRKHELDVERFRART